jgi:tetratricopeptide (TPR) repeat protein
LREHASDREKFFVTAYYDGRVSGNQEKARETCEAWAKTYPRDWAPHAFLSGFIYTALGRYENAIDEAKKFIELAPGNGPAYVDLGYAAVYLDRLQDAEHAIRGASEQKIDNPFLALLRYDVDFLKADTTGMEREVAAAQGKSGIEDWISERQAFALAYSGHMREARKMSQRASDLAQQAGAQETAALSEAWAALTEAFVGNARDARQRAMAALDLARNREAQFGAAFALALTGETSRPQSLASDLEENFPEDTSVKFNYLPSVRGLVALNQREPPKAVEMLQAAVPYELGVPRSSLNGFFGALYAVFVRGQAYLGARQGAEAAAEFQKILNHRGIVVGDPISALARRQLGRAFALSGDKTKAKAAYQDFLTLWKDADPDIPILKQAKAEYAKLQ